MCLSCSHSFPMEITTNWADPPGGCGGRPVPPPWVAMGCYGTININGKFLGKSWKIMGNGNIWKWEAIAYSMVLIYTHLLRFMRFWKFTRPE